MESGLGLCEIWEIYGFREEAIGSCLNKVFRHCNLRKKKYTYKQKVGHRDKTTLQIIFISIILNTYVSLMFQAKFSQIYLVILEKKLILFILASFSNSGRLGYSTYSNFVTLRPWSQVILHVKFENYGYSGLIGEDYEQFVFRLLTDDARHT